MPETAQNPLTVDLSRIDNAEVRRVLRSLTQQMQATLDRQQIQIDALVGLITDKSLGSHGEFKRHVQRLTEHRDSRAQRLHGQTAAPLAARSRIEAAESDAPDEPVRQVYRL